MGILPSFFSNRSLPTRCGEVKCVYCLWWPFFTARKTLFFRPQEAVDIVKEVRMVTRSARPVGHPSPIHNGVPAGREVRMSTCNEV